ncbi:MAG: hypothetical protein EXS55_03760 [Candidatus Magasanikbacteria bacterium]|nr:hypothetical protein [Candidatus Magasanikbacteria bacterium]
MKRQKIITKQVAEYVAIFEADEEVGGYTVTIPELPGCISEGDTFEEALANIREAAELWLSVMRERTKRDWFKKQSRVIIAPVQVAF